MQESTPRKYIRLCIILPALLVIIAVVLFFVLFQTACVITVDNETYGIVEDRSAYEEIVTSVEEEASEILGEDYKLDYDVLPNEELVFRSDVATTDEEISEIENKMFQHISSIQDGYVLRVDGKVIGIGDENELEGLIESTAESYSTENTKEVEILSDTTIEYESVPVDTETDIDNMMNTLVSIEHAEVVYMTQDGDTLEEIAARNDMSAEELVALNQQLEELVETNSDTETDETDSEEEIEEEETELAKGMMLTISPKITYLNVKTVDEEAYTETIAYETEQVYDDTMYVGTSEVTTEGITGSADVVDDVTYLNGNEVRRDTLSREVTVEPVNEVVVIGTKENTQATTQTATTTNTTNSSNDSTQTTTTTTTADTASQSNTSAQTNTNTDTNTNSSSGSNTESAVAGVAISYTNTDKGTSSTSSASTSSSSSSLGAQIAAYAQRFVGCAYVHGGHGPNVFDCSGLTAYVYSQFGITIPWTVEGQYACGTYVPLDVSQMQPGDLIFWSYGGSTPTHVGMYIGNGQYIQATKPGDVVRINTVSSYAGQPLVGCRRIVN